MARAFYIPNNAKFLAANGRQQQERQQQEDRPTTSRNNQPSNYTQPSASASVEAEAEADIEQSGCWDILAQLFCFAARFFGPNTRPSIFHISLEIHNNPAVPTVNSAETQTQTVENATK
ncbi:cell death protein Grim [Glossina fuscipes]|uniref:Cell death protein Grim n=1 Tax=Glossina fuscipes TaxID=7396 RepID=A0A8U0W8H3_9MUSC|nr:cell death protein Grim [Glossina fuscipes]KAI9587938.1 hypothetical protein GQX74_003784 [Glossina fuscipes]